jgi:DNA (cytosine-5)-methyltransferase 1
VKKKRPPYCQFAVVDLFCGVGGLTHGFRQERFKVAAGIDFDETCGYAFKKNNKAPFLKEDVTKLSPQKLKSLYPKGSRRILVGCAPCQPFSLFNHKDEYEAVIKSDKDKWRLLYSFADLVESTKPEIVSMENVPQLMKFKNGAVFKAFVNQLEKSGYTVSYGIYNAQDYGVPQRRKRLILFGSLHGKIEMIPPTHTEENYVTVKDAIFHLPRIRDGIAHPTDPLHRSRKLTPINKKRIMATKEGGGWQDWDESLKLECHKTESGKNFRSVYGRMSWDEVAPTMTTYCHGLGNGRFGHPTQNRVITMREAAILQSFPENYEFIDPKKGFNSTHIARHIGNAVPVGLGKAIAKSIKKHIKAFNNGKSIRRKNASLEV